MYDTSIFIFRRDLRLYDNTALIEADKQSKIVIPIFIFDPHQIKNSNKSNNNCIQFMIESLKDLNIQLKKYTSKINLLYGKPWEVINKLLKSNRNITSVFTNYDYSIYSRYRDSKIKRICQLYKCDFIQYEDLLLHSIINESTRIKTQTGKYYEKFTPYYEKARKINITKSVNYKYRHLSRKLLNINGVKSCNNACISNLYESNPYIYAHGGRNNGLKILRYIGDFKKYTQLRNNPKYDTTLLGAHNKFGTLSIREIYEKFKKTLGNKNLLIQQLYWRDFYYNQIYFNEKYGLGNTGKYYKLKWNNNPSYFNAWKNGKTGIPIVDAGMRQLNETGWMHNRVRMITAMVLTKILLIDWRKGEKYFGKQLLDYDFTQNLMNWIWVSGEAPFSNPYFRIMNPYIQTIKYDPECEYIKKWIPEIKDVPNDDILKWNTEYVNYKHIKYNGPIIDDISEMMKKSIKQYKKV